MEDVADIVRSRCTGNKARGVGFCDFHIERRQGSRHGKTLRAIGDFIESIVFVSVALPENANATAVKSCVLLVVRLTLRVPGLGFV